MKPFAPCLRAAHVAGCCNSIVGVYFTHCIIQTPKVSIPVVFSAAVTVALSQQCWTSHITVWPSMPGFSHADVLKAVCVMEDISTSSLSGHITICGKDAPCSYLFVHLLIDSWVVSTFGLLGQRSHEHSWVFMWTHVFISLGCTQECSCWTIRKLYVTFRGPAKLFSRVVDPFHTPQQYIEFQLYTSCLCVYDQASPVHMKSYCTGFDSHHPEG